MNEKQETELKDLWSIIRSKLMALGYKGDNICYDREKLLEGSHIDIALAWLRNYIKKELTEYEKAQNLVPPSVWAAHLAFGNKDTYEQKELKRARKAVIEVWRTRPSILHRGKVKDFKTKKTDTGRGFTMKK